MPVRGRHAAEQAQLAARHQVTAVLAQSAGGAISEYTLTAAVPRWPAGRPLPAAPAGRATCRPCQAARQGTLVTIWTDANGYLMSPPLTVTQVADQSRRGRGVTVVGGIIVAYMCEHAGHRGSCSTAAGWPPGTPTGSLTARVWNRQRW